MASRKKHWMIAGIRAHVSHAMHSDSGEDFGVQINVQVADDTERVIFGRMTPDQADQIAAALRASADEARKQTKAWRER